MRRILVAVVATIVVVLWLALAGLWVRGYWRGDVIVVHRHSLDEPLPPLQPRFHGRTGVLLSGGGGIAIAMRAVSRVPMLQDRGTSDQTSWTVDPSPSYPQPSSPLAVTGQVMIFATPSAPVGAPSPVTISKVSIPTPTGSFTVSAPVGSQLLIRTGAGPATTPKFIGGGFSANLGNTVTLSGGTLVFNSTVPTTGPTTMGSALAAASIAPPPTPPPGSRWFFAYSAGTPVKPANDIGDLSRVIIFPYWAAQGVMTLPLLWVILRLRTVLERRRRRKTGCCIRCGYDLRATPQRCPECGLVTGSEMNMASS